MKKKWPTKTDHVSNLTFFKSMGAMKTTCILNCLYIILSCNWSIRFSPPCHWLDLVGAVTCHFFFHITNFFYLTAKFFFYKRGGLLLVMLRHAAAGYKESNRQNPFYRRSRTSNPTLSQFQEMKWILRTVSTTSWMPSTFVIVVT